jgi:hypothetical protein
VPVGWSDWLDGTKLREEFTQETRITITIARPLGRLDERKSRERFAPTDLVVGGRQTGR